MLLDKAPAVESCPMGTTTMKRRRRMVLNEKATMKEKTRMKEKKTKADILAMEA